MTIRHQNIEITRCCDHLESLTGYSTSVRFKVLAKNSPSETRYLLPPSCSLLSIHAIGHAHAMLGVNIKIVKRLLRTRAGGWYYI